MSTSTHGEGKAVEMIFKFAVAPLTSPLFEPRMVSVKLPAPTLLEAVSVKVDEPSPVIVGGLKLALTPGGRLVTLRATGLLNPFSADTFTVKFVVVLTKTLWLAGLADSRKLF